MNIIKIILTLVGIFFGVMLLMWLIGMVSTLLWYGFWLGLAGAAAYGGYRLFRKAEDRYVGPGSDIDQIESRDFNMTWDEYERKYLHK